MADNMRIWNTLGKTDPAHTKQFKRAGGFTGTAVKPMWANKQMTDYFGPCGIGWWPDQPTFHTVEAGEEILVYCTVGLGYRDPKDPDGSTGHVWGVGGDKVLTQIFEKDRQGNKIKDDATGRFKTYPQTDDEAFKKAYTDALSNAMKFIGVAADVHMGLFDDSKYVQAVGKEFEEEKKAEVLAEVERQKAQRQAPSPTLDGFKMETTSPVPPELDWSYQKSSGVLICRPIEAKKAKKKDGGEYIAVKVNGDLGGRDFASYFHKSYQDELLGAVGKVCKLMIVPAGKFFNIDAVLEIDGKRMVPIDLHDAETNCRLLASTMNFEEEELRELHALCHADWSAVLEALKARKAEIEAGVEVGQR